jgi:hypothetical protein
MNNSLENDLLFITPHLCDRLVSPQALSNIQKIAKILPPLSESLLECRLGANDSLVDFSVLANASDGSRDLLAGLDSLEIVPDFITHPVWKRIRDFCSEWQQPNSLFSKHIDQIWLEFDVNDELSKIPIPSLFFRFNPIQQSNFYQDNILHLNATQTALDILFDSSISPEIKKNISLCSKALPQKAQFLYIGAMLPRQLEAVRVNVIGISQETLPDYLNTIGWKYPVSKLPETIKVISEFVDVIILNFDVGNIVYPKIGIECGLSSKKPINEPRWQLFLDYLVDKGLCTPEKRDAFLKWSGYSLQKYDLGFWSSQSHQKSSIFFRRLNHFKMVYYPDGSLEAKGYLSFGHRWL